MVLRCSTLLLVAVLALTCRPAIGAIHAVANVLNTSGGLLDQGVGTLSAEAEATSSSSLGTSVGAADVDATGGIVQLQAATQTLARDGITAQAKWHDLIQWTCPDPAPSFLTLEITVQAYDLVADVVEGIDTHTAIASVEARLDSSSVNGGSHAVQRTRARRIVSWSNGNTTDQVDYLGDWGPRIFYDIPVEMDAFGVYRTGDFSISVIAGTLTSPHSHPNGDASASANMSVTQILLPDGSAVDPACITFDSGIPVPSAPVPEPTTLAIWGTLGGLGLIAARRRRKA